MIVFTYAHNLAKPCSVDFLILLLLFNYYCTNSDGDKK